jgi:hypothetical protein
MRERPPHGTDARDATAKPHWHAAVWVAAVVFCVVSLTATQLIDRYAPGNGEEGKAMERSLEQRFGHGKILRVECAIVDRVRAWRSDRLPTTVTVHEWGAISDPDGRAVYTCTLVRAGDSWQVEDVHLVVAAPTESP